MLEFLSNLFSLGYAASCTRHGKLSYKKRQSLPSSAFGLPRERRFPMPDASHARNAKARASMALRNRTISRAQYAQIVGKADRIIKRCR